MSSFDGAVIDYSIEGDGDLSLLFVHGWSCNRRFFQPQVEHFSSSFHCLAPDLPGRDSVSSGKREWNISTYAEDIACLIDKAVPGQVVLIGHSMAGAVVLEAAALRPAKVAAVVMADTHVFDYGHLDEVTISGFLEPMQSDLDGFIRGLVETTVSSQTPRGLVQWISSQMSGGNLESALPAFEALLRWDALPCMQTLEMPVIAIHSGLISGQAMRRYARFIKSYALADTGHFLQLENADGFNRLLRQSLVETGVLAS